MSSSSAEERERIAFLLRVTRKEAEHLAQTDTLLFAQGAMDAGRAAALPQQAMLAERVDAFVARFGRLQDTLGDKLLPALLLAVDGRTGPLIDNLNRATRLGWLENPVQWLAVRRLRNQMVHEYVEDPAVLADALNSAHEAVPLLTTAASRWAAEWSRIIDGSSSS